MRAGDGSSISKPASKGTDWRIHGVFDLGCGRFSHMALTDCHGAEPLARGAGVDGEIRIADRNYARAGMLHSWRTQIGGRVDFIVRCAGTPSPPLGPDGKPCDLV